MEPTLLFPCWFTFRAQFSILAKCYFFNTSCPQKNSLKSVPTLKACNYGFYHLYPHKLHIFGKPWPCPSTWSQPGWVFLDAAILAFGRHIIWLSYGHHIIICGRKGGGEILQIPLSPTASSVTWLAINLPIPQVWNLWNHFVKVTILKVHVMKIWPRLFWMPSAAAECCK